MFNFWRINKKVKYEPKTEIKGKLNSDEIKRVLGDSDDIVVKEVYVNSDKNLKIRMINIDGLADNEIIDENVLKPLITEKKLKEARNQKELYELINDGVIYHVSQKNTDSLNETIQSILSGQTAIIFDNIEKAVLFDAKDIPKRGIEEPSNENVLKGAKDGFIENLRTNTALTRKKIKSPKLRFKKFIVGNITKTQISVVYLEGITDEDILNKLSERIEKIDIEDVITAGKVEEQIVDNKFSIFPQVVYTERVDKFCASIVDGKVGILIDGLPISYIVPAVFPMFMQAPEDYSQNYFFSSTIRFIRYICLFLTLIIPGFYVAITSFHQEMIPTDLAISIIESKAGVPFSTVLEVFFMLIAFEILLEASLRLPKSVGSAVSIIGGLIVGEAAVSAKFVSPGVVVVVAIAGVAGFVISNQSLANSLRICRILILLSAAVAGLLGISVTLILLIYYLCKIEVFGIPYMIPYASNEGKSLLRDTIFRMPFNNKQEGIKNEKII